MRRATEEATRAIAIAPNYAAAHAILAASSGMLYFVGSVENPTEVQRIRAMTERALALEPENAFVLAYAGFALTIIGLPNLALRHTAHAVRKAPNEGAIHWAHGATCCLLNRIEEALDHLATAIRLTPGWHIQYLLHAWRANAFLRDRRWAEADAAYSESWTLNPELFGSGAEKAIISLRNGRADEAQKLFQLQRVSGDGQALAFIETMFRRLYSNSSVLDELLADLRTLWAATKPGA